MNKLIPCLLLLLGPAAGLAQDEMPATEDAGIRRYTVEVIIFRYAEDVGTGSERFLPDEVEEPPDDGTPLDLLAPTETGPEPEVAPAPQEEPEPLPDIELALLDEDDYQLNDTLGRLERLDAYEPLMHFGWTQTTWPEDETAPIPLHLFGRPPADLDGSLTLYLSRYLHLVVDLQLQAANEQPDTPPVWYRIHENRILRNGELRYYDHPKFGLLARVTRVEESEPGEGELLGYPIQ